MTAHDSQSSPDEMISRQGTTATTEPNTDPAYLAATETGYGEPRMGAAAIQARAVGSLRNQASRIVANWVLRAANLPAFRATPNLALDKLQDTIPALLDAALAAIAYSDPTMDPEPLGDALELAEAHGRKRADEGFGIGVLLAEYQHLRMEVWTALWRIVDADPSLTAVPRELQSRLSSTFDSLAAAAAEAWVDRRLSSGHASRG
jgi:hypothetical protein